MREFIKEWWLIITVMVFVIGGVIAIFISLIIWNPRHPVKAIKNNKALIQCSDDTRIWIDLPDCVKE